MKTQDSCSKVRPLIEPFLDGELPAHEQEEVKAELGRCAQCRAEFERLSKLRALVREVYVAELRNAELDDILPGVLQRIEQEPVGLAQRFRNWMERYRLGLASPAAAMGIAATVMAMVMAGTLVYVSSHSDTAQQSAPTVMAQQDQDEADVTEGDAAGETAPSEAVVADGTAAAKAAVPSVGPVPRELRANESFVTYYTAETGTVVIDTDPDGEEPTVLWHLQDDGEQPAMQEDGQI